MVEQKEELKTLKDLEKPVAIFTADESIKFAKMPLRLQKTQPHFVYTKDLRQVIIKWIKELREARRLAKDEGDFRRIQYWSNRGILILDDDSEIIDMEGFCKLFYKIKEEELK